MMNLSLKRGLSHRSEFKRSGSIKIEDFFDEGGPEGGRGGKEEEEEKKRDDFFKDYQEWRMGLLELRAFLLSYELVEPKRDEAILKKLRIVGKKIQKNEESMEFGVKKEKGLRLSTEKIQKNEDEGKKMESIEQEAKELEKIPEEEIKMEEENQNHRNLKVLREKKSENQETKPNISQGMHEEIWVMTLGKRINEFYELKIMEFVKDSAISFFALQPLLLYY